MVGHAAGDALKAIGIMLLRDAERLRYPWRQALASFSPLDGVVIVGDSEDPGPQPIRDSFTTGTFCDWRRYTGPSLCRLLLKRGLQVAVMRGATHVCLLDADEVMHAIDVADLKAAAPDVAFLPRWTFWRTIDQIRLDWTVALPRWAAIDALLPSFDAGAGDGSALPLRQRYSMEQFPQWPIFHYGRAGAPRHVAAQRRATARMFAPDADLDVPEEYDFVPRRFDCWLKGRQQPAVPGSFASYHGEHPSGIAEWAAEVGR